MSAPPPEPGSFYDAVGGAATFRTLVDRFYAGVATDPVLRPLYPDGDLDAAADRLRMFLEQYWGGPTTYSQRRGHPRLRMRHAPFAVTPTARDHWLDRMSDALAGVELRDDLRRQLWAYLTMAADSLINTDEPTEARTTDRETDPTSTSTSTSDTDSAGTSTSDTSTTETSTGDAMPTRPTHLTLPTVQR